MDLDTEDLFGAFEENAAAAPRSVAAGTSLKRPAAPAANDEPKRTKPEETLKPERADGGVEPAVIHLKIGSMATRSIVLDTETTAASKHQVAIPEGYNYIPLSEHVPPAVPAKEYPFTLDPFQRQAVRCLERNESVLVSAHTSAGKTVVAEYAIAMALRDKQRVIYTTPIKALSNQKFREFTEEFVDVGLMTGDVTINPNASCLVMTTEILRSMLYRGSEVMREVAWVIFDEVHYMRDKERGVVWEETLILMPDNVHYVFLSATIPNAIDFARWIAQLHWQPCHVVYTDYRPTPLQHFLFPSGSDGLFMVVDEKGTFREDNFDKAMMALSDTNDNAPKSAGGKGKPNKKSVASDIFKIVKMIMDRSLQPVIVFSFSKRECEAYATQVSKLDFNGDDEKASVDNVFNNAIDQLSEDDKKLPQVEAILPLLRRGIGIHHSGLLPILKEVIEILFQEGLIKALFATETFAMGLNMPAKTVIFTSVRKFDGKEHRWVSGGEYIQMSGRAGRRGLDDKGIVIQMVDEKMEPHVAMQLLKGEADKLTSAFHVTYNMLLNLLRVEELNPEYMLERSFFQFQHRAAVPELEDKRAKLEAQRDAMVIDDEAQVAEYYQIRTQLEKLGAEMKATLRQPEHIVQFLNPGRLARVVDGADDWGWGVVVNFQKKAAQGTGAGAGGDERYIVEMLLVCAAGKGPSAKPRPRGAGNKGEVQVIPVLLDLVDQLSSVRVYLPKDLRPADARRQVEKTIGEVQARFPGGLPVLDPIEDMKIDDPAFTKLLKKIELLEKRLYSHALHKDARLEGLYAQYAAKEQLGQDIAAVRRELKRSTTILQMDDLKCKKRVLRRLGYTSPADVIDIKGRVACEISSADELLLTDMIFNGVFNDLTVEQAVALLSCFVFQEKTDEAARLKDELAGPLRQMQESARRIARISKECKLELDEEEYVQGFRPEMMDVAYAWAKGAKFSAICKMTDVFEGSIIRCMRRQEELMRQLCIAARAIGNTELENKFAEGITRIKRDIVFAASLYL